MGPSQRPELNHGPNLQLHILEEPDVALELAGAEVDQVVTVAEVVAVAEVAGARVAVAVDMTDTLPQLLCHITCPVASAQQQVDHRCWQHLL